MPKTTGTAKQTAALFKPPTAAERAALGEDIALPSEHLGAAIDATPTGQTRKPTDALIAHGEATPSTALRAMSAARNGDVAGFVPHALEALRRDPNLRSVMQTRILAVASLPIVVEAGGPKAADKRAAATVQELFDGGVIDDVLEHLLFASYLGFSGAQAVWDTGGERWTPKLQEVPHSWFVLDKADGKSFYLAPREAGGVPSALPVGKFVLHTPWLVPGNPLTSGIAYTAIFYQALKALTARGWAAFAEIFGQPLRLGKYPAGLGNSEQGKKDLDVLKRALSGMGQDAWAMIPESLKIDIIEAGARDGSAQVYERLCRFIDEQLAKLTLGGSLTSGTGNTGSGGSQALGVVHDELRADIMRADARSLANTLRRDLVAPFVRWNLGADVAIPRVQLLIEEAEDLSALTEAVAQLVPLGLRVSQDELRARLNLRTPTDAEEVLSSPSAPSMAGQDEDGNGFTASRHAQRFNASTDTDEATGDDFDDMLGEYVRDPDYVSADADATAQLTAAIESATDLEDLRAALLAVIRSGDIEALQASLTAPLTVAAAAGESGADIGDE